MLRPIQRLLPFCLLALASCVTVGDKPAANKANMGPWIQASPSLKIEIEESAKRLPWTHGIERVELIQWFAQVGEPSYETLLELVKDPREDVACAALAALGATRDGRLVDSLRAIPWPEVDNSDLALERARTLLKLGDWSMLGQLIAGLEDERVYVRGLCIKALNEATHESFEFDPKGTVEARAASVQSWDAWWSQRKADPMRRK